MGFCLCLKKVSAGVASSRHFFGCNASLWRAADAGHWKNIFSTKIRLPLAAILVHNA